MVLDLLKFTWKCCIALLWIFFNLVTIFYFNFENKYLAITYIYWNAILLFIFFIFQVIDFLGKIENKGLYTFLKINKDGLYFSDISSFLGEQAFVSFITTVMVAFSRAILVHYQHSVIYVAIVTLLLIGGGLVYAFLSLLRMIAILYQSGYRLRYLLLATSLMLLVMWMFYYVGLKIGAATSILF